MTILNTNHVRITGSDIASANRTSDVIPGDWQVTSFTMWFHIDTSLYGHGYKIDLNHQVIRVSDGHVFNHWLGKRNLDDWRQYGSDFGYYVVWSRARDAGVESGGGGYAESDGKGLYVFRPSFFIDTSQYSSSLYRPLGTSEFAVGEDHYFWCE